METGNYGVPNENPGQEQVSPLGGTLKVKEVPNFVKNTTLTTLIHTTKICDNVHPSSTSIYNI